MLLYEHYCLSRQAFNSCYFFTYLTDPNSISVSCGRGGFKNLLGSLLFLIVITHSTVPQGEEGGSTHPTRSWLSAVSYRYTFTYSSSFHNLKRKLKQKQTVGSRFSICSTVYYSTIESSDTRCKDCMR